MQHRLTQIADFEDLTEYLYEELDWPILEDDFERITFEYTADELGIDEQTAAKIDAIWQLRPLTDDQPWGIFFVEFEPKRLPVVALRRILSRLALKKRQSAQQSDLASWALHDLMFISTFGQDDDRQISFAHFTEDPDDPSRLPILRVLGWDGDDTSLKLEYVQTQLETKLRWPDDEDDLEQWRSSWSSAFVLRPREVITTSQQLAVRLAELARGIQSRIESLLKIESERGTIRQLMEAFKESLIHDLNEKTFADMYAQTIAYGLLSARIAQPEAVGSDSLVQTIPNTNPFLRELMETFLHIGGRRNRLDFDELGISEVVVLLREANMEAVLLDFGNRNPQEDPIIYFYELFLTKFDSVERMKRGVFYTPKPVVSFIVRSVDELLRTEFGLEDGLADTTTWGQMAARHQDLEIPDGADADQPFVQILDPATGTATFLVEVIDIIYQTLSQKWKAEGNADGQIRQLWNDYVPQYLLPRLHGYELMMAPYAIAHMKIGLKLYETGYQFHSQERVRVYLTNALEPAQDFSGRFQFDIPALAHEAEAVNLIKQNQRFSVLVGNPPYKGHSANNDVLWIVDKVHDYKRDYPELQKPGQAKWLQDDYVKFLRYVEWHIEQTRYGIVGYITNHAWLSNPTFKGMRQHILNIFNKFDLLDLHGNANRKETAPDGSKDENIFEIKQGVSISLLRRLYICPDQIGVLQSVSRSDLFGSEKNKSTTLSNFRLSGLTSVYFQPLAPAFLLYPLEDGLKREFDGFFSIPEIMDRNGSPAPGIVTTHDQFAVSFSEDEQIQKVRTLLTTENEDEAREHFRLCSQKQWIYEDAKEQLKRDESWEEDLVPLLYRPFDQRWTVYNRYVAVHRRDRVSKHVLEGNNISLSIPRVCEIKRGWEHIFCTDLLIQHHTVSLKEVNYLFPLWLKPEWPETRHLCNLSPKAINTVSETTGLGITNSELVNGFDKRGGYGNLKNTYGPRDLFGFIYAVLHSESYRIRYMDLLKTDFARVPLITTRSLFCCLAKLGNELAELHLLTSSQLNNYITMIIRSERFQVVRASYSNETVWLDPQNTYGLQGVPEEVWNFHIGGYQVCEKWLKDRQAKSGQNPRPGRILTEEDINHYQKIVVAIKETIRIMAEVDEVIEEHGGWPDAFQTQEG